MKELAKNLRKNQTDAELLLWRHLRNRQLSGYKFRRQQQLGPFIVDFVCFEKKLVIELDGGQHTRQAEIDNARSICFQTKGYKVLRFWNNQVLKETEAVLEAIIASLGERTPHPDPLPQGERENIWR